MVTKLTRKVALTLITILSLAFYATSCGKKNKKSGEHMGGGAFEGPNNGEHMGGGFGGPNSGALALQPTADLQNAFGLLVVDTDTVSAAAAIMRAHNETIDALGLDAPKFDNVDPDDPENSLALTAPSYTLQGVPFHFPGVDEGLQLTDTSNEKAAMQKINKNTGAIEDALTVPAPTANMGGGQQRLPKLRTIAVSDTKEVYLHFENPFIYRNCDPTATIKPASETSSSSDPNNNSGMEKDNNDPKNSSGMEKDNNDPNNCQPWDMANGYQCQIFKVKGGTLTELLETAPSLNNLECIDNLHFINNWGAGSNSVFQFDKDGNVYYPGAIPNSPKQVVYKRLRNGSATTEVINAQICVRNFLVTKLGGVFYTGNTCQDGNNGGGGDGGGYFRYIAPGTGSQVIEIARDWWNFIFATSVSDSTSGDPTDKAVFFGPYSTSGTTAGWDSACLFKFDPSETNEQLRTSEVISCGGGNDFNSWQQLQRPVDLTTYGCTNKYYGNNHGGGGFGGMTTKCDDTTSVESGLWNKSEWKAEFKTRCESKDKVFAGGGSQINAISQNSAGEIYVLGNIRKKVEGKLTCNVEIRGPHCVINSTPVIYATGTTKHSAQSCPIAGGTWTDKGNCSGTSTTSEICLSKRRWDPPNQPAGKCYLGDTNDEAIAFTSEWSCQNQNDNSDTSGYQNSEWNPDSVWYNNISGAICNLPDAAEVAATSATTAADKLTAENTARENFRSWDQNRFRIHQKTTFDNDYPKFLINGMSCAQANASTSSSGNNSGGWTEEYKAMAKVDSAAKSLTLLSLPSEQAIKLWIVNDSAYYSSYDTMLRQYQLNTLTTTDLCIAIDKTSAVNCTAASGTWSTTKRSCAMSPIAKVACEEAGYSWRTIHPEILLSNFEAYNVAESGESGKVFADGLDFSNNSYKFGTIDTVSKIFSLKEGLTGTIKTIVILPK